MSLAPVSCGGGLSRFAAASCAACVLATSAHARAEGDDGMYGRVAGDLDLRAHAGVAVASGGPALAANLAAVYLATVGVYLHYTDALGSQAPAVGRSLAAGVHLAPAFVVRGALNAEHGPAFLDLLVDSFAFELGSVWSAPRIVGWSATPGLEAALGFDIPLAARATGPFLGVRGALRWRPEDFGPSASSNVVDRGAVLSITLGWHQVIRSHVVDVGDRVTP